MFLFINQVIKISDFSQLEMKTLDLKVFKKSKSTDTSRKGPKKSRQQKQKTFKCKICSKTFLNRWNLNRHITTHSGEKLFKCNYPNCGKSFKRNDNLKAHLKTHSNVRPFKCTSCQSEFKHKKSLKKHMNKMHNGMKM